VDDRVGESEVTSKAQTTDTTTTTTTLDGGNWMVGQMAGGCGGVGALWDGDGILDG
jgi:hypothetical protein